MGIWEPNVTASRQRQDSFWLFTVYLRAHCYALVMAEADPHFSRDVDSIAAQGHILRSAFLNSFALIEIWVTTMAARLSDKVKPNAPLSQKIKVIANEASAETSRFRHPLHIDPLLEQVRSAAALRSNLVHARMITARTDDGRHFWMFQNIALSPNPLNPFQLVLEPASFTSEIKSLDTLIKKLNRQELRDSST